MEPGIIEEQNKEVEFLKQDFSKLSFVNILEMGSKDCYNHNLYLSTMFFV